MMKFIRWLVIPTAFALAGNFISSPPAFAAPGAGGAPSQAQVVSSCGTQSYTAGTTQPLTQNTGGNSCGTASATIAVSGLTSTNDSGSISVTSTFQSIQIATSGRNGCLIQNNYTNANPMWVFFGPVGSATKATSFIIDAAHGLAISCSVGGLGVLTDQVSITGTSGDTFTANFQ